MINTNKPTFYLVLTKPQFEMILKGEQHAVYREINTCYAKFFGGGQINVLGKCYEADQVDLCFFLGYGKNHPSMLVACEGLSIGIGNPNWGAEPNVPYYRLDLGKILAIKNYEKLI